MFTAVRSVITVKDLVDGGQGSATASAVKRLAAASGGRPGTA